MKKIGAFFYLKVIKDRSMSKGLAMVKLNLSFYRLHSGYILTPFCIHCDSILDALWTYFASTLVSLCIDFDLTVCPVWINSVSTLVSVCTHCGFTSHPLWLQFDFTLKKGHRTALETVGILNDFTLTLRVIPECVRSRKGR
ncbi:hypothetical protein KQX54_020175 [Cotesia glomerata]|uniref:Uncharacterized protein n=1 Tax=Cotesia glomerata TaxID=32391 RepID=A0AAV7IU16_COTGL|nr:hypothetical protein KQX54_020175 [Cotesia glomerata]